MNGRLGKERVNLLIIILYYGASSYIIPDKYMKKLQKKNSNQVRWSTQRCGFNTNYTREVEILLYEIDATKDMMRNFHLDDSKVPHMYYMTLGHNCF